MILLSADKFIDKFMYDYNAYICFVLSHHE